MPDAVVRTKHYYKDGPGLRVEGFPWIWAIPFAEATAKRMFESDFPLVPPTSC